MRKTTLIGFLAVAAFGLSGCDVRDVIENSGSSQVGRADTELVNAVSASGFLTVCNTSTGRSYQSSQTFTKSASIYQRTNGETGAVSFFVRSGLGRNLACENSGSCRVLAQRVAEEAVNSEQNRKARDCARGARDDNGGHHHH